MQSFVQILTSHPKKIFLLDGVGAMLTAFFVGVLLVSFEPFIGLPKTTLYALSIVAATYMLYSICCFLVNVANWRFYLGVIIIANIVYGFTSIGVVCYYYQQITGWGLSYFLLEVVLIIALVTLEIKLLKKK